MHSARHASFRLDVPYLHPAHTITDMSPDAYADSLVRRRTEVLGPAYRHFYEEPLTPVRAEDVWLYDAQDRAYLDC